jgi:hypothetical protein
MTRYITSGILERSGFIFHASEYPWIWMHGQPDGTDDMDGRYLVLTSAGLEDVGTGFMASGCLCFMDSSSYRLHPDTMTYYRLEINAELERDWAQQQCEQEGGNLAHPYGIDSPGRVSALNEYAEILALTAHSQNLFWIDGRLNFGSGEWVFQDGKLTVEGFRNIGRNLSSVRIAAKKHYTFDSFLEFHQERCFAPLLHHPCHGRSGVMVNLQTRCRKPKGALPTRTQDGPIILADAPCGYCARGILHEPRATGCLVLLRWTHQSPQTNFMESTIDTITQQLNEPVLA